MQAIPWDFSNTCWTSHETLDANGLQDYPASMEPLFGLDDDITINLNSPSQGMGTSASSRGKASLEREWGFLPLAMNTISSAQTLNPDRFQSDSDFGQRERFCLFHVSEREDNRDEYLPTLVDVKRSPNTLPSNDTECASTSGPSKSPVRKRVRTDRRTHQSVSSRNRQATTDQMEDIRAQLSLTRVRGERPNDLVCPVMGCQYRQLNGRMPDFRRHVKTHIRKDADIRCKGVAWHDFVRCRHLFPNISEHEQPYAVPGEKDVWIGGCLKTFSRADALKRHLKNSSCAVLPHNQLH